MSKLINTTRSERLREASSQRREHEKQELREAILKAASELFLEQGYDRFSLRQVAERIGYSATTIYLYFKDKDDLLFTIVDQGFVQFGQRLEQAAASTTDPMKRIAAIGRAYIAFGLQNPGHYQLMFMQRFDFLSGCRPGEETPRIDSFNILQQTVQQALDAGVLRPGDVQSYSDTLWATVHGLVALAIATPMLDPERLQQAMDVAFTMIYEGLRQR